MAEKKRKIPKDRRSHSPSVTFLLNAIIIALIGGFCFALLLYKTDLFLAVKDDVAQRRKRPDTTVQQAIDNADEYVKDKQTDDKITLDEDFWTFVCNTRYALGSTEEKSKAIRGVFYQCNKKGLKAEYIAGIAGNIESEGVVGQFEGIPYGATGQVYYKNSWANSDVYNNFVKVNAPDNAHIYSNDYSRKVSKDVGITYADLRQMLSVKAVNSTYGTSIFGYGCIQGTSESWHDAYNRVIDCLNLSGNISEEGMYLIECELVATNAQGQFAGNDLPQIRNDANFTTDELIDALGVTTEAEKLVVAAAGRYATSVEICAGWRNIGDASNNGSVYSRCAHALDTYRKMVGYDLTNSTFQNPPGNIKAIIIGDSRTVGMYQASNISGAQSTQNGYVTTIKGLGSDNNYYFAKVGGNLSDCRQFIQDASNLNCDTIIIAMGVNDLGSSPDGSPVASSYFSLVEALTNEYSNVTFVACGPVDETLEASANYHVKSSAVDSFNIKMDSLCRNSSVEFDVPDITYTFSSDGLHYTNSTYRNLYNEVLK